jgi:hypothetical protein
MQLQRQLKGIVKGSFEFRNTRYGTRIVTKEMADYSAIKEYFSSQTLNYFTFYPKSLKPIKAVIQHLPGNTLAEEIYEGLVELGFDIISVKQMSTTHRSQGSSSTSLPLFLITLPRSEKSREVYKLTSLCYTAIKVELYKSQSGFTQCHNCQQFGHVWANCKQPPRCLWCGGGHLHRECPEKGKEDSTPACCNCKLAEGGKPHPSTYRGCSHTKEKRRKKIPRTPKPSTGRVFSSKYTTSSMSFAEALQSKADQTQQSHPSQAAAAATVTVDQPRVQTSSKWQQAGQTAPAQIVNSSPLDNMVRVVAVVQQFMTEYNGALSKEAKIQAISKIVLTLLKENDQ